MDLLTPGRCDGIVGALSLNLTARQLADMTPDPKKMPCPGTESPIGCGGNSNYDLYYSVARGKRPDTGQLLSYGDAGTPGNVSDPVVVGFGGWLYFKFLFAGTNLSGEHRIYAVNQDGQLLSYGDAGTPGNVSDPVVVGLGGWLGFKFLFAGTNLSGEHRLYAVNQDGQLLSYGDAGTTGNVSDPVVVGFGGWLDFKFLFAVTNLSGEPRIYAVVA